MSLPEQLLLSDLLSRRVRCDRGLEHGPGQLAWMHPPVHRLLGWASRPSALSTRRCVWRLDQLRGLTEAELLVQGEPAETDAATLERLPTLLGAVLLSASGEPLGRLADAAVELASGRIRHYLVARSDPRLPGGSRWRLSPDRIVDQRPGEVSTALQGLADLPLAHASLRETLLRRSRRWRDQWGEEASRLRDQWQQAGGRFEQRLEGWLEEPPWQEERPQRAGASIDDEVWPEQDWTSQAAAGWDDVSEAEPPRQPGSAGEDAWFDREDDEELFASRRSSGSGRFEADGPGPVGPEAAEPDVEPWDGFDADPHGPWDDDDLPSPPQTSQDPFEAEGSDRRSVPLRARRGRPAQPPEQQDDPWV